MKNLDPVVNGYSRSVIANLIETLEKEASRRVHEATQRPQEEEHDEVVGMRSLVGTHNAQIKMLMKWSMCRQSLGHITRHLVGFRDFLSYASYLLSELAPAVIEE
ncbi:MAG: hypothetical protein WC682_00775 [Parcubacteria group bacterium]|jgi:hypothetical protein